MEISAHTIPTTERSSVTSAIDKTMSNGYSWPFFLPGCVRCRVILNAYNSRQEGLGTSNIECMLG
jgi:hypothetical protein